MPLFDMPLEVHRLMEDAPDLDGLIAETIKVNVLATPQSPAAIREIVPRFASGKKWIGNNAITT